MIHLRKDFIPKGLKKDLHCTYTYVKDECFRVCLLKIGILSFLK